MNHDLILAEGKYLRLINRQTWEFAQRTRSSGVVGIVAITNDHKLLLVQQLRHAVNRQVIEIPAGLVGDTPGSESENLANAAIRELQEETGFLASSMHFLASGPSSPGVTDETITLFRARNLVRTGPGGGDDSENITVHEIPLQHVPQWLIEQMLKGLSIDLKVYSALFFAQQP